MSHHSRPRFARPLAALVWLGVSAFISGCASEEEDASRAEKAAIRKLSPLPELPADPTNSYADDLAAAELGQMLFHEKQLSGPLQESSALGQAGESGKVSCATCHVPQNWFSDNRGERTSQGLARTERNNMTVVNSEFQAYSEWSGTVDSGWGHTLIAFAGELGGDRMTQVHTIYELYKAEYDAVFDPNLDPALDPAHPDANRFPPAASPKESDEAPDGAWEAMAEADRKTATRVLVNAAKAVEAYQRQLVSRNAPFDAYVAGDTAAIGQAAQRGLRLFIGKAGCVECHSGPTFSDNDFHNISMPKLDETGTLVPEDDEGHYANVPEILAFEFNTRTEWSDAPGQSPIIGLVNDEKWRFAFRTQSLRQVGATGPFGHTGQFATLREVVEFYNDGFEPFEQGQLDELMKPLNLTDAEVGDIVEFLDTLTGEPVDPRWTRDTSK